VDTDQLRTIIREEIDTYLTSEVHTSLVVGSGRRMSIVQMIRFIDLHTHETRKVSEATHTLVKKIADAVATRLETKEDSK